MINIIQFLIVIVIGWTVILAILSLVEFELPVVQWRILFSEYKMKNLFYRLFNFLFKKKPEQIAETINNQPSFIAEKNIFDNLLLSVVKEIADKKRKIIEDNLNDEKLAKALNRMIHTTLKGKSINDGMVLIANHDVDIHSDVFTEFANIAIKVLKSYNVYAYINANSDFLYVNKNDLLKAIDILVNAVELIDIDAKVNSILRQGIYR